MTRFLATFATAALLLTGACASSATTAKAPLESSWSFSENTVQLPLEREALDRIVAAIKDLGPGATVVIYGSVAPGERPSLAKARAHAVLRALISRGAPDTQLKVEAAGFSNTGGRVWLEHLPNMAGDTEPKSDSGS